MFEVISTLSSTCCVDLDSITDNFVARWDPRLFLQENFTHVCAPENTNVLFKLLHESARVFWTIDMEEITAEERTDTIARADSGQTLSDLHRTGEIHARVSSLV